MEGDGASWSRAGTGSWVRGGWQLDGFHLARELHRVLGREAYGTRRQRGGGHDPGRTAGELPGIAGGHGPAPGYGPWDDPSAERHGLSNLGHALRHLPTWDRFRTRPRSGRARLVVLLWCTGDVPLLGDEFDWDEANCNHVREAGVEPEEAEEALLDPNESRETSTTSMGNIVAAPSGPPRTVGSSSSCSPCGVGGFGSSLPAVPPSPRSADTVGAGNDRANEQAVTMKTIHSVDEIPTFGSESEESAFWATHEIADDLWERLPAPPEEELPLPRPRTRPVGIRFDEHTLRRIKALAARRHKGYQTLLREFITERLYEEEQREGLVKPLRRTGGRRKSRSGEG